MHRDFIGILQKKYQKGLEAKMLLIYAYNGPMTYAQRFYKEFLTDLREPHKALRKHFRDFFVQLNL